MRLPSKIHFADKNLKESFLKLAKGNDTDKKLFKAINKAFDKIETNAYSGLQIEKRLFPKLYLRNFQVDNLWKYNLTSGWRIIYTITKDDITIISIIIEWLPHKEYENRFKY